MRLKSDIILLICISMLFSVSRHAFAHKVNVFCWFENGFLRGEGYYSGGNPVKNAEIEVYSLDNHSLIARMQTNDSGKFEMKTDSSHPLKVVMNAGRGHRAEFMMEHKSDVPGVTGFERQTSNPGMISIFGGIGFIAAVFSLIYFFKKNHAL